jgi:hypothetical protein
MSIPAADEVLSNSCFLGYLGLKTVTFEAASRLGTIEPGAFAECESLSSIDIPASVAGCVRLTTVTFDGASPPVEIVESVFYGCPIGGTPATGPLTVEFPMWE